MSSRLLSKTFFKCFIDVVFVLFLIKGKCKLSLNQQHGIYDNGKALPQVYRERVLDLYHQGSTQRQISQDMRVSIGYVNKVVQFYEQSNSSLPAPRKTPVRNIFTADVVEYVESEKLSKPSVHTTEIPVRVKGGMSLRNGMWHGLRNDIIMRNVKYGNWRKEIN